LAWATPRGEGFIPGFGLGDGEFGVAVDEDVIGDSRVERQIYRELGIYRYSVALDIFYFLL
jgi:hypothetical protein